MNLEDKLFHGIKANIGYGYNEIKDLELVKLKLERILIQRKILCRNELKKIYGIDNDFSIANFNYDNLISLAKHPSQKNEEDTDEKHIICEDEDAWIMYPFNQISLVLNKELLKKTPLERNGIRIPLEVQVKNYIDVKYLEAVSIPGSISTSPFFQSEYSIDECINSPYFDKLTLLKLNMVIELLNKYNIQIPIIDITTGNEYKENMKYRKRLKYYKNFPR